jgi:hypothetical protein
VPAEPDRSAAGGDAPLTGVIPLRPLSGGEVVAGSLRFLRAYPVRTFGIAALGITLGWAGAWLAVLALEGPDPTALAPGNAVVFVLHEYLVTSAGWIVTILADAILNGLVIVTLHGAVLGRRTGLAAAWRAVAPRLPGLIGLHLLIGLTFVAIFTAALMSVLVAAQVASDEPYVPPPLLLVLAVLFALAIHLAVLCTAAPAAYVVEQVGVLASLSRSRHLVRGAWWRTFAALTLVGLLVAVLAVVVLVPLGAQAASTGVVLLEDLGLIVVATVAVPFGYTAAGILYVDLRIRRERYDLDLARP